MNGQRKPKCGQLTWKAKKQGSLHRREAGPDSELWDFVESWLRRFRETDENNSAEKFIYLWVTVNAWASMVVPDRTKNHEDAYLIHSMAADSTLGSRFNTLLKTDPVFQGLVDELASLAPVFQVLWLRNKGILLWNNRTEARRDFIRRVWLKDPYHRIYDKQGNETATYPAFAPACAYEHISAGQDIPTDWPHTLSAIYQIRCNLFHGGKTYDSSRDRNFITLAYSILRKMWEPELPAGRLRSRSSSHKQRQQLREPLRGISGKHKDIEWHRALIRSGFLVKKDGNTFDLSEENEQNQRFLHATLEEIGQHQHFKGRIFSPPYEFVEEYRWLEIIERLHGGAEGGSSDMQTIELGIMDTFMAGIVRWTNSIGIETTFSCDGHGRERPRLHLADSNQELPLDNCLRTISEGRWRFRGSRLEERGNSSRRNSAAPDVYDRSWLLNVAERLHEHQTALRELVEVTQRVTRAISHSRTQLS